MKLTQSNQFLNANFLNMRGVRFMHFGVQRLLHHIKNIWISQSDIFMLKKEALTKRR